jgi:hypothetical protein
MFSEKSGVKPLFPLEMKALSGTAIDSRWHSSRTRASRLGNAKRRGY